MTEYSLAWLVYSLSALVLLGVVFMLSKSFKPLWLRSLVRSLFAALWLTPALVDAESGQRAPAIMAAMMEFLSGDQAMALSRLGSLTTVLIILFGLALLFGILKAKIFPQQSQEPPSNETE